MATIGVTFGSVAQYPGGHLVYSAAPRTAESVSSSGASAASTNSANGIPGEVCTISVPDGAKVWATFGTGTPTAAAGTTHLLGPGRHDFSNLQSGWKVAVIDA